MSRDGRPAPAAPNTLGAKWQAYAEQAEAEADGLREALREAAALLDRLDLPEGSLARERFAVVRLARQALSEPLDREEG